MAGILLDTSYLFWLMEDSDKLLESGIKSFHMQNTSFCVSAVSILEMRLKFENVGRSGERKSPHHPKDVVSVLEELEVTFLPVTVDHASCLLDDPMENNQDPFDTLLFVQAQAEGLEFLALDRKIIGHPLAIQVVPP